MLLPTLALGYSHQGASSTDCGPNGCWSHGECIANVCHCETGYGGEHCQSVVDDACLNNCNGHGRCTDSFVCECHDGFGPRTPGGVNDCLGRLCGTACGPHGTCDSGTGECACEPGWTGRACAEQGCPSMCSGHGVCNTSAAVATCQCDAGYSGADCATQGLGQGFRVRVLR